MNVLVTGGAGYVGSILVERLIKNSNKVIVLDNLQSGHIEAVAPEAIFIKGDFSEIELLNTILKQYHIEAVMHLAGETLVGLSTKDPGRYFHNNVIKGIYLLDAMVKNRVDIIIFSSSAAVYGNTMGIPIKENTPEIPINSYGESKLMFEKILSWYNLAYNIKYVSLRYFNACGASQRYGEDHRPETHLIPIIFKVIFGDMDRVQIFGTDYETKDGSCIRDYIHVLDISKAHILCLENINNLKSKIYNLGNGKGYSVIEIIEAAKEVIGKNIPSVVQKRREGDPAHLVACPDKIKFELGWEAQYKDIKKIIETAWNWHRKNPKGYIT
jgi:UDP-glucose 4-epimerase